MLSITRRELLKVGFGAAAMVAMPRPVLACFGRGPESVPPIRDPRIKELAFRAVEAAKAAGASYVDVRLMHKRIRTFSFANLTNTADAEELTVGVRALVDGYWGFAGSPVWSPEEMARLGREAVQHAKVNALGLARAVELAPRPIVTDAHWETPVEIDPFEVSPFEIVDYQKGLEYFAARNPRFSLKHELTRFELREEAFACSDGSYLTQRLFSSEGLCTLTYTPEAGVQVEWPLEGLSRASVGWELYKRQPMRDRIEQLMEEMREHCKLPVKPVEVGRYAVVCDAESVARLVDATLGAATELDRALGYEANADGTSYLNNPLAMMGAFEVAGPMLTLTANRSEPGGAATVRWDAEGVEPDEFTIVKEGILTDFQTTRESAGWLAECYRRRGQPVRSHGCAVAESGNHAPLQRRPNLVIFPGTESLDFDDLVGGLEDGIAVKGLDVEIDFQGLSGLGVGQRVYEIKGGRPVARIVGAGFLFRAPELWKSIAALGGPESVRRYGLATRKGQPAQVAYHSVTAPPAVFEQFTVIDVLRKA